MDEHKSIVDLCRVITMYIATLCENIFGGYDGIFITLVVFISVDYITGIVSAIIHKKLSSRVGAIGIAKKIAILCIIALTSLLERSVFNTSTLRNAVILYYISNEGISIVENFVNFEIPVPSKLKNVLLNIKNDEKDG